MSLPSIPSQFPQPSKLDGVNWKAVAFWAVVLGLIFATVWWFYGDAITTSVTGFISNPQLPTFDFSILTLDNVVTFIKEYGFVISIGFAAFTALYGFYQKHKANEIADAKAALELQKIQAESYANEKLKQTQSQADSYKYQYEQALKNSNAEALTEAQNLVTQKEGEVKALKAALADANEKLTSIPYREVVKYK